MRSLTALAFIASVSSVAAIAAPPAKVTGIYSDLHLIPEAGDVLGTEIFLVFGGEHGYYAVIQCAEGWPSKPVVVTAIVRGTEVELAAHDDKDSHCPKAKFKGTVSSAGLEGKFEGTNYPELLKRKRSYWQ